MKGFVASTEEGNGDLCEKEKWKDMLLLAGLDLNLGGAQEEAEE